MERTGARAGSSQPPRKDGALSAPPGVSCVSRTEPSCGAQAHGPARRRPGASALLLAWPDSGFDAHGACAADPQTPWPALGTRCLRTWRARPRHRPTMSPTQTWARRHHLCTLQALSPSVLPVPLVRGGQRWGQATSTAWPSLLGVPPPPELRAAFSVVPWHLTSGAHFFCVSGYLYICASCHADEG